METTKTNTPAPELHFVGSAQSPARRSTSLKRRIVGAAFGVAALAAVTLAAFDAADSNEPAGSPGVREPRIEAQQPQAADQEERQTGEVVGGCLNDVECYGEPSQLPPTYSETPAGAPAD